MKNYATSITVNDFDIRVKGGFVRLNDLKKAASSLGYNSFEGSKWVDVTCPEHFVDVEFLVKIRRALDSYRKSATLRNLAEEAKTSMREALWASGGGWSELVQDLEYIASLVLGCTTYGFTVDNNLPEDCYYLEYLTDSQIQAITILTRINTTLIEKGVPFSKRRNKLNANLPLS